MTNNNAYNDVMETIQHHGLDGMVQAMTILFNEAMKMERSHHLNCAPYERTQARQDYANGFKPKTVNTRMGTMALDIPQTRASDFYPSCLQKGLRSEQALYIALAEMYIQGVSTRNVTKVLEKMSGLDVSSTQVSNAAKLLDEQVTAWKNRPLGQFKYLYLDARYEKVRSGGQVTDGAVLIALGVDAQGKREILGLSIALSEAEVHWRSFLQSLVKRGLHGLELVVSDAHSGLKAARQSVLPAVPWQRCQFHLQQNAGHYVSKQKNKAQVAQDLRQVFNAPSREQADHLTQQLIDKYQTQEPRLAQWIEDNLEEGLTVFGLGLSEFNRKRLRTTNVLERINQTIKKRSKLAKIFPNVESCERLIGSILMEQSEAWIDARPYISLEKAS